MVNIFKSYSLNVGTVQNKFVLINYITFFHFFVNEAFQIIASQVHGFLEAAGMRARYRLVSTTAGRTLQGQPYQCIKLLISFGFQMKSTTMASRKADMDSCKTMDSSRSVNQRFKQIRAYTTKFTYILQSVSCQFVRTPARQ